MKLCSALVDFKEVCYFLSCGFTAVTVESNFDPVSLSKTSIKTFQTATGHLRILNTHILFKSPPQKATLVCLKCLTPCFSVVVFFGGGGELQEMQRQTSQ